MEQRERSDLSWLGIGALVLAGAAAGVVGGVVFAVLAGLLLQGRTQGLQDLAGVVLGLFAGFVLLAPLGVALAGRGLHARGSVMLAYVASVTAGLVGIAIPNLLPVNAFSQTLVVSVPLFSLVAAVAVYAFTNNRRTS